MKIKKRLFIAIFLIFILSVLFQFALFNGPVFAQSKVKCYTCGRELQPGTYWLFGNKPICQQCYSTLPRCEICKIPVKNFVYVDGEKVCYECYYKLPSCGICGRRTLQLQTLKDTSTGIAKSYCRDCLAKHGLRCATCGKSYLDSSAGRFHSLLSGLTGEKIYYCDNCFKTLPMCYFCGLLVRSGINPVSDGRYLCEDCLKTAVYDYNEVKAIYDEAASIIPGFLNSKIEFIPPLYLCDQKQLKEVQKNYGSFSVGEDGFYWPYGNKYVDSKGKIQEGSGDARVYILFAQPRAKMYWTAARELGNVWFYENCPYTSSSELKEGFAQWVAYKVAQIKGYTQIMIKEFKRDDVYGSGLRKFVEIERRGGVRAVLKHVKAVGY
ncbi:MAG: hypothetical protein M1536_08750 [Firmicutes bacterium]|nr:hypothetical protein [Bacillota bacterium]